MSRSSPPKKVNKPEHVSSLLLSQEANTKIFSLLEPKTQALGTAIVSVILSKPPKHPEWRPFRVGVATLIKDHGRKTYFVQIYDIVDWEKVREEELTKGTAYQVSLPTFHQFETTNGQTMGLKFSSENEARSFAQTARTITMTGHYKTDGCPMPVTIDEGKDIPIEFLPDGSVNQESQTRESQDGTMKKENSLIPPQPPPPVKKDQTLLRPPRPASVNVPLLPPPPPPPVTKNTKIVVSQDGPQPCFPPPSPANKSTTPSPTTTPVNRDAPMKLTQPSPATDPGMNTNPLSPTTPLHPTATIDRKRQKSRRFTKDMIGKPTNFQHVYHVGYDPNTPLDQKALQSSVGEAIKRSAPVRPPPPPPPGNCRNSTPILSAQNPVSVRFSLNGDIVKPDKQCTTEIDYDLAKSEHPRRSEPVQPLNMNGLSGEETEKSDESFRLVPRENTPSGELMEELLDYLQGIPFDACTNLNNSPNSEHISDSELNDSLCVSTNDAELSETTDSTLVPSECSLLEIVTSTPDITITDSNVNSGLDQAGSLGVSTSVVDLQDTSDSTLVPDSEIPPDSPLPEIVASLPKITSTDSTDNSDLLQADESKEESMKSLDQLENQSLTEAVPPTDTSEEAKTTLTDISSEIPNNLNELEAKSSETLGTPTEIQPSQIIAQTSIHQEMNNDHSEDIKTQERNDANIDNDELATGLTDLSGPSDISSDPLSKPLSLNSSPSPKQESTQSSDPVLDNLTIVDDEQVPPQKPARRKSANKSMAPSTHPPPTETTEL